MVVETYSDKYFQDVMRLVESFHAEAVHEYDSIASPEAITQTIRNADHANLFLLVIDGVCQGLLYGTVLRSPTSGQDIFQEVMWYVHKPYRRYGVRLLKEVENILKLKGVGIMIMAVLENSKTDKLKSFYERLGFKLFESHYLRML